MGEDRNTVLVVDDDAACRDLHAVWLAEEYEVLKAADGQKALELVDRADVMLLDREMPGVDGEEVAHRVHDSARNCFIVMLSGVEPDFDVIDLPVDEYLTKPVTREQALAVVEKIIRRNVCQRLLQEYLSLAARKKCLERQKRPTTLAKSDEYRRLAADLETKRVAVRELLYELDDEYRERLLAAIDDTPTGKLV